MVERYVRDVEAAGSNPVTPIHPRFYGGFSFLQKEKAGWLWFGLSGACQIFGFGVARLDNLFSFHQVLKYHKYNIILSLLPYAPAYSQQLI